MGIATWLDHEIRGSIAMKASARARMTRQTEPTTVEIVQCLRAGKKLILFGDSASAASAPHIAAEVLGDIGIRAVASRGCLDRRTPQC